MLLVVAQDPALERRLVAELPAGSGPTPIQETHLSVSGSGLLAARGIRRLGHPVHLISFAGGRTGRLLQSVLEQEGLDGTLLPVSGPTPCHVTICSPDEGDGVCRELRQSSSSLQDFDAADLLDLFVEALPDVQGVVLAGASPSRASHGLFASMLRKAGDAGVPVILDSSAPALIAARAAGACWVRVGREVQQQAEEALDAIAALDGAAVIATNGERPVLVRAPDLRAAFDPPAIAARPRRGGGAAMLAGLAVARVGGKDLMSAVRYAIAVAAADLVRWETCAFSVHEPESFLGQVHQCSPLRV